MKWSSLLNSARYILIAGVLLMGGAFLFFLLEPKESDLEKELARLEEKHLGAKALELPEPAQGQEASKPSPAKEAPVTRAKAPEASVPEAAIPFYFESPGASSKSRLSPSVFPPEGRSLGVFRGQVFYPLQQRFSPISVNLILSGQDVFLYGASLCEEVHMGQVVLAPCIFLDRVTVLGEEPQVSIFEADALRAVQVSRQLTFYPWSRFATSYLDCGSGGDFRMSVQYGNKESDVWVSIRVPVSSDPVNALEGLRRSAEYPCGGLDIFFHPDELTGILLKVSEGKTQTP